jgi:signal peptidase I
MNKIWAFLKEDSWPSLAATLLIAFITIKYLFFPLLTLLTGTTLPLVIVESCSMYHHDDGFNLSFTSSSVYDKYNITIDDTSNWDFQNGFSKGDIIFVVGIKPDKVKVGDVVIFEAGARYPLIHRLVDADEPFATKGDNDITNTRQLENEKSINADQLMGKALFRVRGLGWIKLIFYEPLRSSYNRGFCS